MSDIIVREVTSDKDLRKFIEFPIKLYKDSNYYVPPLASEEYETFRRDKNPAYEYCDTRLFLAYKDGQIAGRICVLHNKRYNEVWNTKRLRFTRFDFIDDFEVSKALMDKALEYACEFGLNEIHGPIGFSDFDKQGMLVEGFDEINMFVTPYNYEYYLEHMERLGYAKDVDWIEYLINLPEKIDERICRVGEIALRRNKLRVMQLRKMKDVLPIAYKVFDVLYQAYKDLYGYIPLNEKQIDMYINQFISFLTPDFISIILNEQDEPVSVGIVMPSIVKAMQRNKGHLFPFGFIPVLRDMNKKTLERVEFLLIGTLPEYQHKGINAIIINDINEKLLQKRHVKYAETGPMLESNDKIHSMWKHFDKRQHKRRRCYIKEV